VPEQPASEARDRAGERMSGGICVGLGVQRAAEYNRRVHSVLTVQRRRLV
jgi:hypothetical protein